MSTNKIVITTDCVCDLPEEYLKSSDVDVIYFYISTAKGRFRDRSEISSENVLDYLENIGGKATSEAPTVEDYISFFRENIVKGDELIHITISSVISCSYENAVKATELMGDAGKNIHVIDSRHLSTSIGILTIKAVELRNEGLECSEICDALYELIPNISTTFIVNTTDYLYQNERISKTVNTICKLFKAHPVLVMKDGDISLKNIRFGNYEKAYVRYINSELRNISKINRKRIFITYSGLSKKETDSIKKHVEECGCFTEIITNKSSATISCNCGPKSFGILFTKYYEPE